jgi:hypothetical protein
MRDLKSFLLDFIRDDHYGKGKAITVDRIICELTKFKLYGVPKERRIRQIIRELNFDGYPILTSIHPPFGVYYAVTNQEKNEYLGNLGARMKAILMRMKAVDKIQTREFIKGQLELFQ